MIDEGRRAARVLVATLATLAAADGRSAHAAPADPGREGPTADAALDRQPDAGPDVARMAPIGLADRAALAAFGEALPRHGLAPIAPPDDGDPAAWASYARALLEPFAPSTLSDADRRRLVRTARPLHAAVAAHVPSHPQYHAIQARLVAAATASASGAAHVASPPYEVRVGVTAPEVTALRTRLALEGYDAPARGRLRAYFDDRLKRVLWDWQRAHDLPITVVLDPLTRRRLNAGLARLVVDLALALARWRAVDLRDDAGKHVVVHLNRFALSGLDDGAEALSMRAVIGRATEADETPTRSAPLVTMIAHPDWRLPRRIARRLRAEAQDVPEVLMDAGYEVRVDRADRWWIRQPPGPDNPLGTIKFILRDTGGVYLHDTPAPEAFDEDGRALSHGCVRVERARALAAWIVPEARGRIDDAIADRRTHRVDLEVPVPVHLVYQTLTVDDGVIARHDDVYARDAAARAGIDGDALVRHVAALPEGDD